MQAKINSASGYLYLDSWILSSILHLGTIDFCKKFLNNSNDPGGRQYAQMTQAARSAPANIAEGSSRRDTSKETFMKLTDVARATVSELAYDYLSIILSEKQVPWETADQRWRQIHDIRLTRPEYSHNLMHDVGAHILSQKKLFDPWLQSNDRIVAANAMLIICGRIGKMIKRQLEQNLEEFSQTGGFTENLTTLRIETLKDNARKEGSPLCPKCGKPMLKRTAKKGQNAGSQFWSCSDYPNCRGTRPISR